MRELESVNPARGSRNFIMFLPGMLFGLRVLIHAIFYKDLVQGWATVVVLQTIIGGAILLCLGMVGEYVGRLYEEIKQRPLYIVRRRMNIVTPFAPPRGVVPPGEAAAGREERADR